MVVVGRVGEKEGSGDARDDLYDEGETIYNDESCEASFQYDKQMEALEAAHLRLLIILDYTAFAPPRIVFNIDYFLRI